MNPILRSRRSSEPPGKDLGPVRLPGSSVPGQQASWPCDRTLPRASQALHLICQRFPGLRRRLTQRPTWMPSENKKSRIRAFDRLVTAIPDRTWPTKGRPARGITAPLLSGPKISKMEELGDAPAQVSLGIYLPISCVSVCSRWAMKKTPSKFWVFHCFGVYFLKSSRNDAVCPGPPSTASDHRTYRSRPGAAGRRGKILDGTQRRNAASVLSIGRSLKEMPGFRPVGSSVSSLNNNSGG
jgi:hypothetical protein